MAKKKIIITAGGTREYIDPVRFISNASSGRMGCALAVAAVKAGYDVILISAAEELKRPKDVKFVPVQTAKEMFEAVKRFFSKCDCLIMAAAVSDYAPAKVSKFKIKKTDGELVIRLKPTIDILRWAGRNKRKGRIVVGFALEDRALRSRAERKMEEKRLDIIIANTPIAIGAEESSVLVKRRGFAWQEFPMASKAVIAGKIIRLIQNAL